MLVAAAVVAALAALLALLATAALVRAPHGSPQRMLVPAQFAAAAILAAGALSAVFTSTATALVAVAVCAAASVATLAAAGWQVARYVDAAQRPATTGCDRACGGCPGAGSLCTRP